MADYPRITGTIRSTPRNRVSGFLADLLELGAKGYDVGSTLQAGGPITEGRLSTPVSDLLGIPELQRTLDRVSYNEPLTTGAGYTTRLKPDTVSAAMTVAPMVGPAAKAGAAGARMTGTALKDLATSDVAYNAMMNAMRRSGGMAEMLPQEDALMLAQRRAALPVKKGGLGLPANNTAEDRAKAMGFDPGFYHGSPEGNIQSFKPHYHDETPVLGVSATRYPGYAEFYAAGRERSPQLENAGTIYPLNVRKGNWAPSWLDYPFYTKDAELDAAQDFNQTVAEIAKKYNVTSINPIMDKREIFVLDPEDIRSRFAAFDPFRRNTAVATAMGVAAPDLLAKEKNEKKKKK